MTDLLLTGASGQLGWEVARRAARHGLSITACGHADLDITDAVAVAARVRAVAPRVVVNAAAYTAVDRPESEPDKAFAINADGPRHLAEACAEAGAVLIHVSTDYVFAGTLGQPWREDDPVDPPNTYGRSKLAGEEAVRAACPRHVILRTAWVYGVHGHNFVKTMLRLAETRAELTVVDDQRGTPTFAGDLAEAVLRVAANVAPADGAMAPEDRFGTFHCTNAGATTWCGFANRIFSVAAPHLATVPDVRPISTAEFPTPARRPANSVLDCGRLEAVHGIAPRGWTEALDAMLAELLAPDRDTAAAE